jgi:hypothetical protein
MHRVVWYYSEQMPTLYLVGAIFGAAVTVLMVVIWLAPGSALNPVTIVGPFGVSMMCFQLWKKARSKPK